MGSTQSGGRRHRRAARTHKKSHHKKSHHKKSLKKRTRRHKRR